MKKTFTYKLYIYYFKTFLLLFCSFSALAQNIDAKKQVSIIEEIANHNLEDAITYSDSILQYNFPNKNSLYIQNGNNNVRVKNYKKALSLYKEVEQSKHIDENLADLAWAYLGIGETNILMYKKQDAIEYISKATEIGNKLNDAKIKSESAGILAQVYYSSDDFVNAIKHIKKAIEIQKSLGDKSTLSTSYNNIAVYYERKNQLDSAQYYNIKTLDLNKQIGDNYRIAISYNNMGNVAKKLKNFSKTEEYYKKSIQMCEKIASNDPIPFTNLATLYLKQKKFTLAKEFYEKTLTIAIKNEDLKEQELTYNSLLKIAIQQKDFEASLQNQKLRDSLIIINASKENKDKIKFVNKQFEQALKEEKLQKKIEINKKNRIILAIVIGLLLLVGLLFYQRNRNSKLQLTQEKLILEQKVLQTQMNPHFIFNALGAIQKTMLENDPLQSASALSKFSKLIRKNFEFINKSEISLTEDLAALANYIETQQLRFAGEFEYKINIQDNIKAENLMIPPMLLQPFVENAIEHGIRPLETKGFLEINISEGGDFIHFEIVDNGVGYTDNKRNTKREHATDIFLKRLEFRKFGEEKLFSIKNREKTQGTKVTLFLKLFYT